MSVAPESAVLERRDAIARLTIARPAAGNALRGEDVHLLSRLYRQCLEDPRIRVVVICGEGPKFFCSGGDIAELASDLPDICLHISRWHELLDLIEGGGKPAIAAINGIAVGGGLELALACHQRIAAGDARVGLPEVNVGLFPAAGGIRRLTRLIGAARTIRLVLSAELMRAEAAREAGIVDEVCEISELHEVVDRTARRYAELEPNAVRATLALASSAALGLDSNELETTLLRECYATPRNREVLKAFMSRRRPTGGGN